MNIDDNLSDDVFEDPPPSHNSKPIGEYINNILLDHCHLIKECIFFIVGSQHEQSGGISNCHFDDEDDGWKAHPMEHDENFLDLNINHKVSLHMVTIK